MQTYQELIDKMKGCLIGQDTQEKDTEVFKNCVVDLEKLYGKRISTAFLKGLMDYTGTEREKTNRISYLISYGGLQIKKQIVFMREWVGRKYKVEVIDYIEDQKGIITPIFKGVVDVGNVAYKTIPKTLYFIEEAQAVAC